MNALGRMCFGFVAAVGLLQAQAPGLRPLHVTAAGTIADDAGRPVTLRGLNRAGTASGNADANATDQEYAAQNRLLSMNLVRLFVNAAWWNANVRVPIANAGYQDYIDQLVQRAKKYGNYVLILNAAEFPDPPCGADGRNCPAGGPATGSSIDTAFAFWAGVAKRYAADPAVLYETWEDMRSIDDNTWSNNQNELIAVIRTYSPQSLIFVGDTGAAFESTVAGKLADLAWSNIVWSFHLYPASTGPCSRTASPRYTNWPRNFDPLVIYAQQHGHAAAITEWGGCNDGEPYHTDITSYAQTHGVSLAYQDSSYLLAASGGDFQLTSIGQKVAQAYSAFAPPAANTPSLRAANPVQDAVNNRPEMVPGAWISVYGTNFSGVTKDWSDQDFSNGLPDTVAGVQVLVNGRPAPVWYVFPGQVNFQAPSGINGTATVAVRREGTASNTATVPVVNSSPGVIAYTSDYVTYYPSAQFVGGTMLVGDPAILGGGSVRRARPGDQLQLYATGLAPTQSGVLIRTAIPFPSPVTVNIGSMRVTATFAAQVGTGYYQINFTVPPRLTAGNHPFTITVNGETSQSNVVLPVGP